MYYYNTYIKAFWLAKGESTSWKWLIPSTYLVCTYLGRYMEEALCKLSCTKLGTDILDIFGGPQNDGVTSHELPSTHYLSSPQRHYNYNENHLHMISDRNNSIHT